MAIVQLIIEGFGEVGLWFFDDEGAVGAAEAEGVGEGCGKFAVYAFGCDV